MLNAAVVLYAVAGVLALLLLRTLVEHRPVNDQADAEADCFSTYRRASSEGKDSIRLG